MKSQSALEFMTIVGIGLIILAVTSALGVQSITSYSSDINTINARQTVNSMISATKLVYSQGINSQTNVFVNVPENVIKNRTYLYNGEINYRFEDMSTRDYFQKTGISTYGLIPTISGKSTITIRMLLGDVFSENMPGIKTGAFYYLDDNDISLALVETYFFNGTENQIDNTTYYLPEKNFSSEKSPTIRFILIGFNSTSKIHEPVNETVVLSIYRPDSSLFFREEYTAMGASVFIDMQNSTGYPGHWLVSLMDPKTEAVATTLFYMED